MDSDEFMEECRKQIQKDKEYLEQAKKWRLDFEMSLKTDNERYQMIERADKMIEYTDKMIEQTKKMNERLDRLMMPHNRKRRRE